jgi:alpha-D-xyloside xylohydrolase
MAFGSFTPIWRPHGIGKYKRWPLDRSQVCQDAALRYGKIRYELMPYIYSNAHIAQETGIPMARAMVIDYSNYPQAWQYDLQYMWGDKMLVAPSCASKDTTLSVWLPPGQNWYNYWNDSLYHGNETLRYQARVGYLPVFIKEGAIIPRYHYALSTFTLDPKKLILDVYAGKDGSFTLYEDDGVTEKFRTKGELRKTEINYQDQFGQLTVAPSSGSYKGAPSERSYQIIFHGIKSPEKVTVNGQELTSVKTIREAKEKGPACYWNEAHNKLYVFVGSIDVHRTVSVKIDK